MAHRTVPVSAPVARVVLPVIPLALAWLLVAVDLVITFEPDALPAAIRTTLDPSVEGGIANALSAALLALLALVGLVHAARSVSAPRAGVWSRVGWPALALIGAFLAFDELTDFHLRAVSEPYLSGIGPDLGFLSGYYVWVGLAAPFALLTALGFVLFISREFADRPAWRTAALTAGLLWVTALAHEAMAERIFASTAPAFENLLEEGAELIGTAGLVSVFVTALLARPRASSARVAWRRSGLIALGTVFAAALLAAVWAFLRAEVPLNSWGPTAVWMGPFPAGTGATQTFRWPDAPVARVDLRVAYQSLGTAPGELDLRVLDAASTPLREVRTAVPTGAELRERSIRFAALDRPAGQSAILQVSAAPAAPGAFTFAVTDDDLQRDGALFANGEGTPTGQDLNYRLYTPRDPIRAKLAALGSLLRREPVYLAILIDALAVLAVGTLTTVLATRNRHARTPP